VTFVPAFVSNEVAQYEKRETEENKRISAEVADTAEVSRRMEQWSAANPRPQATLAQVADHIEHVRKVAGADHVGIGSDFDGIDIGPAGLEDVSSYPALFAELIRRGWPDADLRKLAGENVLRVMRQAESVSRRLRAARPASTATIEALDGAPPAARAN